MLLESSNGESISRKNPSKEAKKDFPDKEVEEFRQADAPWNLTAREVIDLGTAKIFKDSDSSS